MEEKEEEEVFLQCNAREGDEIQRSTGWAKHISLEERWIKNQLCRV